jgi:predicted negative regulator of RcsB-dependent stress response
LIVIGCFVLAGVGWLIWQNQQAVTQQFTEIDQKYAGFKESFAKVEKDITNAKNLEALNKISLTLSQSIADLKDVQKKSEQFGYQKGLDDLKPITEAYENLFTKLTSRITNESNAKAKLIDSQNSVIKIHKC